MHILAEYLFFPFTIIALNTILVLSSTKLYSIYILVVYKPIISGEIKANVWGGGINSR